MKIKLLLCFTLIGTNIYCSPATTGTPKKTRSEQAPQKISTIETFLRNSFSFACGLTTAATVSSFGTCALSKVAFSTKTVALQTMETLPEHTRSVIDVMQSNAQTATEIKNIALFAGATCATLGALSYWHKQPNYPDFATDKQLDQSPQRSQLQHDHLRHNQTTLESIFCYMGKGQPFKQKLQGLKHFVSTPLVRSVITGTLVGAGVGAALYYKQTEVFKLVQNC